MVQANTATVRLASNAEAGRIARMMTLGFADDPVCRRLYPDPEQYLTYFPEFVRLYGGAAFDHGGANVIDGMGGVCQRSCPPISCGVSDFRGADFVLGVEPDGSGGLPVAGFA